MRHLIDSGTVEIVDKEQQKVVGYAFVEDGTDAAIKKVQRWVLYSDYRPPPYHAILLRTPTDPARRYTTLSEWKAALENGTLWKAGAKYIKVNCAAYDAIVDSPALPPRPAQQLLDGPAAVRQSGSNAGQVYTVDGGDYEHWVLFDTFVSAPAATVEVGPPDAGQGAPTLNDFLDKMRQTWRAGSTYEISACTSFSSVPSSP